MLSKKIKTVSKCEDAITAYHTFSVQVPEMVSALSGFLYATESDKAVRLMEDLQTILCKARDRAERAERELQARPKRRIPPPVDLSKIPDIDPTDKWEDE